MSASDPTEEEARRSAHCMRYAPHSTIPDAMQAAVAGLEMSGFDRADLSLPEAMPPAERATPEAGAKPVDTEEDARQTRTLHTGGRRRRGYGRGRGGHRIGGCRGTRGCGRGVGRAESPAVSPTCHHRVERRRAGGSRAQGGERRVGPFGARAQRREARRGGDDPASGGWHENWRRSDADTQGRRETRSDGGGQLSGERSARQQRDRRPAGGAPAASAPRAGRR